MSVDGWQAAEDARKAAKAQEDVRRRAELKLTIAGSLAAGMLLPDDPHKIGADEERAVVAAALRMAERLMVGCGL